MVTLLSLLLLAHLFTPAQEQVTSTVTPPLEVLDVEVRAHEVKAPAIRRASNPWPSGPMNNSDVNKARDSTARREQQIIESRPRDIAKAGTEPGPPPVRTQPSDQYHYEYRVRVKNVSPRKIKSILWEYQLTDSSGTTIISQRLFLCVMTVKAGSNKLLRVGTFVPPIKVVSADSSQEQSQKQRALINRVEYSDRSTWVREGWKPDDLTRDATTKGKNLRDGQCTPL